MSQIIVRGTPKIKCNDRRDKFNAAVVALAPIIAAIRAKGIVSVPDTMQVLNNDDVAAPNGKAFSNGTMYRVLTRLAEMNLAPRTRSVSRALSDRWEKQAKERHERYEDGLSARNTGRTGG
jgi:hypothetical protein